MKKMLVFVLTGGIGIVLLTACNFPSMTSAESTEAPVDLPLSVGETPPSGSVSPLPEIDLAGPTIGSEIQWIDNSLLIFVPGGEFLMGKTAEVRPEDHPEHPEHVVEHDVVPGGGGRSGSILYETNHRSYIYTHLYAVLYV
ncbi:MAG: hypothetical protein L3J16_04675 [Anaerolineales bacterium]|nr:hypothetical protein [Anaerolineales bacterium]